MWHRAYLLRPGSSFGSNLPYALVLLPVLWTAWVQNDPFFWDTVQLASKHAHFFFENKLYWAPLPQTIDSGHPPVFGYYLACIWSVLGKTLPASHWALLPFLTGIGYILWRLADRLHAPAWSWGLLLLVWTDPVVAGQSALVSPDIVLIFSLLLAIYGLLNHKPVLALLGVLGLCAISMRGMMSAGALLLWQLFWAFRERHLPGFDWRRLLVFAPGFAFAAWFLWWHRTAAGWTGFHPASPWAQAFERVGATGFFRNMLVLAWRWLDFGRFLEWVCIAGLWYLHRRGRAPLPDERLLTLLLALLLVLSPSALFYHNLSAHRYFLPLFTALHLFVFQWLMQADLTVTKKRLLLLVLAASLASGNLWVYPRGVSMDWDATLAHLPYHRLRAEMVDFLEKSKIDFQTVGSAFPNLNTGEQLLLNGDQRRFAALDFQTNRYIFASNIFNDIDRDDYRRLQQEWLLLRKTEKNGVWIELYARR